MTKRRSTQTYTNLPEMEINLMGTPDNLGANFFSTQRTLNRSLEEYNAKGTPQYKRICLNYASSLTYVLGECCK